MADSSESAALMIVEFSRGNRPNWPNSQDSEIAISGASFCTISAARRSMSPFIGENTEVIAAVRIPSQRKDRAASATATFIQWRDLSYRQIRNHQPTRCAFRPISVIRSSGQSVSGGMADVAGSARRIMPTGSKERR